MAATAASKAALLLVLPSPTPPNWVMGNTGGRGSAAGTAAGALCASAAAVAASSTTAVGAMAATSA